MKYDITFHPSWWHKNADVDFTEECDVRMRKVLYENFGAYGIGEKNPEKRPILGSDLIASGYFHSALAGCEIIYSKDNAPQVKCMELDEEDLEDFSIGDYKQHPLYRNMVEQVTYLKEKFGYVCPAVNLMGIQNIAMDLMGHRSGPVLEIPIAPDFRRRNGDCQTDGTGLLSDVQLFGGNDFQRFV